MTKLFRRAISQNISTIPMIIFASCFTMQANESFRNDQRNTSPYLA